jgi:hypothetical protein
VAWGGALGKRRNGAFFFFFFFSLILRAQADAVLLLTGVLACVRMHVVFAAFVLGVSKDALNHRQRRKTPWDDAALAAVAGKDGEDGAIHARSSSEPLDRRAAIIKALRLHKVEPSLRDRALLSADVHPAALARSRNATGEVALPSSAPAARALAGCCAKRCLELMHTKNIDLVREKLARFTSREQRVEYFATLLTHDITGVQIEVCARALSYVLGLSQHLLVELRQLGIDEHFPVLPERYRHQHDEKDDNIDVSDPHAAHNAFAARLTADNRGQFNLLSEWLSKTATFTPPTSQHHHWQDHARLGSPFSNR